MSIKLLLKCTTALLSLSLATAAIAQTASFDVKAQDALTAIPEFAEQAGIQIIAPAETLRGIMLPAIKGNFTMNDALKRLLENTNLEIVSNSGSVITLKIVPKKASQLELRKVAAEVTSVPVQVAQVEPPQQVAQLQEEMVVTGTRIVRDGYEAPTPLTVIDSAALAAGTATGNIAATLTTFPVFAGNIVPTQGGQGPSSQGGGINALNLRGLGTSRTLILVDGQRTVASKINNTVDIGGIPQQLVSRVDVVTGGASAVYGSDAVGGVVNFILDKEYTGVKGELSGGLTSYGDNPNWKLALASGIPFAGGRGHVLLSGEINNNYGIKGQGYEKGRTWSEDQSAFMTNPAYGTGAGRSTNVPERILVPYANLWYPHGNIIDTGPLKGIAFGEGGVPYNFPFGAITDSVLTSVTPGNISTSFRAAGDLDQRNARQNAFVRGSYDVTDDINVFAQLSWVRSFTRSTDYIAYEAPGSAMIIQRDNPFIPLSVQGAMDAAGVTSFRLGGMNYDQGFIGNRVTLVTNRNVVGADGQFGAFGSDWSWNAYFQNGYTRISYNATGVERKSLRALAIDAVRHPTTGTIVCRSTLTNPTNGCIPWNPMGVNVNSDEALNYIRGGVGESRVNEKLTQNVWAGSVTGEPFSNWAGPVSIALSAEHRVEKAVAVSDAASRAFDWRAGNYQPFDVSYNVTEGAIETVIPIANGTSWVDQWDVTLAARATDYSTSGYVTTWKAGTTFAPMPDVKIRANRSRDIRAPTLFDLYSVSSNGFNQVTDARTGLRVNPFVNRGGNPNLRPEKADTTDVGIVVQPSFLPGLSLAVDYWNIKIKDGVTNPNNDQIQQFCLAGRQEYCDAITYDAGGQLVAINQVPFNLAVQIVRGIDFEGSYRFPPLVAGWSGELDIHGNATVFLKNYTDTKIAPAVDNVGTAGSPDWRLTGTVSYTLDTLRTSLTARAMSPGLLNATNVLCSTACPVSTATNRTVDYNRLPGFLYFDASISYGFDVIGHANIETFLNVRNIFNRDPAIVPTFDPSAGGATTNVSLYDTLGRVFRAGVRFKL